MSCYFFKYRNFRIKIALSLIFKKKIRIYSKNFQKIYGFADFELDLLCFIDKFTNGTDIRIKETGDLLDFFPGILTEYKIEYKTTGFRSLSYYLEFFLYVSLFLDKYNEIKLIGIRSVSIDVSLENVLYVTIPLLRRLGLANMRFKVYTYVSCIYNTELVFFFSVFRDRKYVSVISQGIISKIRVINTHSSTYNLKKKEIEYFFSKNSFFSNFDLKILNVKLPGKNFKFQTITSIIETTEGCGFGEDITFFSDTEKKHCVKIISKLFKFLFEDIATGSCVDKKNHIILFLDILNKNRSISNICIGKLTFLDVKFFRDLKKINESIFSIKYNHLAKVFFIKLTAPATR